jgi:hypothetical protein
MAPKLEDRPIVMIEPGEAAKAAFNAVDGTIVSISQPWNFLTVGRILVEKQLKNNGNIRL